MESKIKSPEILSLLTAGGASTRLLNAISRAYSDGALDIKSKEEYFSCSIDGPPQEFYRIPNLGRKSLIELHNILKKPQKNFKAEEQVYPLLEENPPNARGVQLESFGAIGELISKTLNVRDACVISRRYGFDGERISTLTEIGVQLGITRERVRQIEAASTKKIRNLYGSEFSRLNKSCKSQIEQAVWGRDAWLSKESVSERIGKLHGRLLFSLEIGANGAKNWILENSKCISGGYLSPSAMGKDFECAMRLLRRNEFELPSPVSKVSGELGVEPELAIAAYCAVENVVEYQGWICRRPFGARTRRFINLINYIGGFGRAVPVTRERLLADAVKYGELGASYRDLEIVLRAHKKYFINMYEEGWATLVPREYVNNGALSVGSSYGEDTSGGSSMRDFGVDTVRSKIYELLKKNGALSLAKIRDRLAEDKNFGHAVSSIGPILILSEQFIRLAPGVYDIRAEWEQDWALSASRRKELVNEQQIRYFCQASWAGESISLYPAWRPELFNEWASYAFDKGLDGLLASILSQCSPDRIARSAVEARAWTARVGPSPKYALNEELSVSLTDTLPNASQVMNSSIYCLNSGRVSWMSANRVNGSRLEDRHASSILAVLIALDVIYPAAHWQAEHKFNPDSEGLVKNWIDWIYRGGEGWPPFVKDKIRSSSGLFPTEGWLSQCAQEYSELTTILGSVSHGEVRFEPGNVSTFDATIDKVGREILFRDLNKYIEDGDF